MGVDSGPEGSFNNPFLGFASDDNFANLDVTPVVVRQTNAIANPVTAVPDTQAVDAAFALGLSPEVAAGLNPETLARIAANDQKAAAFLNIQQTRPEISESLEDFESILPPEVISGLNPAAINRVARDPVKSAAFVESVQDRPAFAEPSLFDRLTDPITGAVSEGQQTVKRAVTIFLILLVIVVIVIGFAILS